MDGTCELGIVDAPNHRLPAPVASRRLRCCGRASCCSTSRWPVFNCIFINLEPMRAHGGAGEDVAGDGARRVSRR